MSWEELTALGTVASALIIAATVVLGLRQVSQLRRATQLDGSMRIYGMFAELTFHEARRFVFSDLAERMQDPVFLAEVRSYPRMKVSDHPELILLNFLNMTGSLVAQGALDGPSIYAFAHYTIIRGWQLLAPVVREHRLATDNPLLWRMGDLLYDNAVEWFRANARGLTRPSTGEPFKPEFLK
jgi:hypothetical protein